MKCIILAGGFATRLWPLTEKRAKPLLPLAGKPILTHLTTNIPSDIPITVSTNAVFAKDMQAWAKTVKGHKIEIYIEDVGHEDEKLGALGAVSQWIREKQIKDDVLLLAGDNYIGFDIATFIDRFHGLPLLAAHDIKDTEQAKKFGTVLIEENVSDRLPRITSFEEKPEHPKSTLVSTGCYVLPEDNLAMLATYAKGHPDNIGGIFEEFLRQQIPIECYVFDEMWKDIGSFHSYLSTHDEILAGSQMIDASAKVDEASKLEGSITLGQKTIVKESTLTNCIIFGKTKIDDCILENCIIDEGCKLIGVELRDKMLRAGTVLKRE